MATQRWQQLIENNGRWCVVTVDIHRNQIEVRHGEGSEYWNGTGQSSMAAAAEYVMSCCPTRSYQSREAAERRLLVLGFTTREEDGRIYVEASDAEEITA